MYANLWCVHNWKRTTFVKCAACKLLLNIIFQFGNVFFGRGYGKFSCFAGGGVLSHLLGVYGITVGVALDSYKFDSM